ncbi:MAG: ankyrin repeat domain-containing protein [Gammaproteobacteria bacterium]|nr:ankyrin repeat domain-containing protein [Gammaproteobacteria bacterium]
MLKKRIDLKAQDKNGDTALHKAVWHQNNEIAKAILKKAAAASPKQPKAGMDELLQIKNRDNDTVRVNPNQAEKKITPEKISKWKKEIPKEISRENKITKRCNSYIAYLKKKKLETIANKISELQQDFHDGKLKIGDFQKNLKKEMNLPQTTIRSFFPRGWKINSPRRKLLQIVKKAAAKEEKANLKQLQGRPSDSPRVKR